MKSKILTLLIIIVTVNIAHTECICPDSLGAKAGSKPLAVLKEQGKQKSLVVCGYLEKQNADNSVIAAEFQVFQCGKKEPLLTYGALQKCKLKTNNSKLEIIELITWPFGENWKWIDIPYRQTIIKINPYVKEDKIILKPPKLKKETIDKGIKFYESNRNKNEISIEIIEKCVGIIFTIALTGDKRAQQYLKQMRKEFHLDGYASEIYSDALATYNFYSIERHIIPYINE